MKELVGKEGEKRLSRIGMEQMLVTMGHQACGAMTLWNYPSWLRNLIAHDINGEERPDPVDMAALESIYFYIYIYIYIHILFRVILFLIKILT